MNKPRSKLSLDQKSGSRVDLDPKVKNVQRAYSKQNRGKSQKFAKTVSKVFFKDLSKKKKLNSSIASQTTTDSPGNKQQIPCENFRNDLQICVNEFQLFQESNFYNSPCNSQRFQQNQEHSSERAIETDKNQELNVEMNKDGRSQFIYFILEQIEKGYRFEDFDAILPVQFRGFLIKKLTWENFVGITNPDSQWKAHTFWTVCYNYEITMRKMKKSNNIRYYLQINSWCILSEKCWAKVQSPRLLEHETGHYLLGCICALEFKKRADKQKYSKNFRAEAIKLFQKTVQEYVALEQKYDEETCHSRNVPKQKEWNRYLISQLEGYMMFYGIKKDV